MTSPLKSAVEAYVATPADATEYRAELFATIEEWIYAEFEAEPDMTEEKLAQIDVTEFAHTLIARADY